MNDVRKRDPSYYLRCVADNATLMLSYWDRELRCCFANRAYQVWFGVDPDKLVGRTMREVLGPQLFALNEPYIEAVLRGEKQDFERMIPGPDGITRHSIASYIPDIVDGVVVGFMVQVTDVSKLKETQAKLQAVIDSWDAEVERRRSIEEHLTDVQQSLAVTLASIGAGFLATDRNGCVIRMNEVAQHLLEWTEDQAHGHVLWEVLQREGRPPEMNSMSPIDVMLENGFTAANKHEIIAISRTGVRIPVELNAALMHSYDGAPRGMAIVFRDMMQVQKAETDRQRAEERFRLVVESAPTGILMVDRSQLITLANRKAEELFGYSRAELLGQPIEILVPPRIRRQHASYVQHFFAESKARAMGADRELFGCRKDGSQVPVEVELSPLKTSEGLFMLASISDITERKRTEVELRRSNEELEQFAYIASHDLQEPLRMVASYTALLAQRYAGKLDDKANKYIRYAVEGATRMHRLVADLLTYSRVGSQGRRLVPVSAAAVLAGVLERLGPAIRSADAVIEAGPLPTVLADEEQLGQVLQNLIGNALKFHSEAAPRIRIEAILHEERYVFAIRDNGIGIDMQYADRIFQMFQRLHERGKYDGSGIGLTISKRIVERHGGRIWLESQPGVGSTFFFTLLPAASR